MSFSQQLTSLPASPYLNVTTKLLMAFVASETNRCQVPAPGAGAACIVTKRLAGRLHPQATLYHTESETLYAAAAKAALYLLVAVGRDGSHRGNAAGGAAAGDKRKVVEAGGKGLHSVAAAGDAAQHSQCFQRHLTAPRNGRLLMT